MTTTRLSGGSFFIHTGGLSPVWISLSFDATGKRVTLSPIIMATAFVTTTTTTTTTTTCSAG